MIWFRSRSTKRNLKAPLQPRRWKARSLVKMLVMGFGAIVMMVIIWEWKWLNTNPGLRSKNKIQKEKKGMATIKQKDEKEIISQDEILKKNTTRDATKYLQFGTQSGWSNQLACLEHAIWLADALDRTLVLPPILPHHGQGSADHTTYSKKTLKDVYTDQHPYVPLLSVLDRDAIGVPVIDYNVFGKLYSEDWTEYDAVDYSHRDTQWVLNQFELLGFTNEVSRNEMGRHHHYVQYYKDLHEEMDPYKEKDILTFKSIFYEIGFHSSVQVAKFKVLYVPLLREAARRISQSFGDYASIHIRGGDGVFRKRLLKLKVVEQIVEKISKSMVKHFKQHPETTTYTLHVATDVPKLQELWQWQVAMRSLARSLESKVNIQIRTKIDYKQEIKDATKEIKIDSSLFIDQLVAACAPIGFAGTSNIEGMMDSTFTVMIDRLRKEYDC